MRCNVIGLLQIATFFSNNLDFFTSSGYSPRGSTLTLNPLQAENMLANKKKAAAYIQAITKVSSRVTDFGAHIEITKTTVFFLHSDFSLVFVKNSIIQIKCINNIKYMFSLIICFHYTSCFVCSFSPGHSLFHTEKPCQTVVYLPAPLRAERV